MERYNAKTGAAGPDPLILFFYFIGCGGVGLFGCSSRGGLGRSCQSTELLVFEFNELLFTVHFDDEGYNEDEECGASDPSGLAW